MDKFSLSKMGIHAEFTPIVDRDFKVIANEALLVLEEDNPNQFDFEFFAQDLRKVQAEIDLYFKRRALGTYKGTAPLILPTITGVNDPFPDSLSLPEGYELIINVNQPQFWFEGGVMGYYDQLASNGVTFAVDGFGQSHLLIPFILKLRPQFIKLSYELIHFCSDDKNMKDVIKLVQPYRDLVSQIVVNGIDSETMYERMKPLADAFQGDWVTKTIGSKS